MSDRATTLKERLKQRRSRMQETSGALSEEEKTPRKTDRTWDAAMEEEESRSGYASLEMEEEVKESEKLVKSLKKKRKKVKQELDETVRTQEKREDVGAELHRAKQRTKKKVKDAEERSATEAEETAASAEEILDSDRQTPRDKTPRGKPPSRDRTPRDKSSRDVTPRDEAKAGKVEDAVVHATTSEALMQEAHDTQPLIEKEEPSKKTLEDKKKARRGQGLGESYRKKLADKMKAAKDKGKDEAYDSGVRMLKDKRGQPVATRFDNADEMRKEDIELEESLQQTITARQKLREAAAKAKAGDDSFASARIALRMDHIPTPEEAFDFFTRQWEPDPEQDRLDDERRKREKEEKEKLKAKMKEREKEEKDKVKEEREEAEEEGDKPQTPKDDDDVIEAAEADKKDDEIPLLEAEERLGDAWKYYMIAAADYEGFRQKMEHEEKAYFFPSIIPAPLDKKVQDEEAGPRFPEEEGLYVGVRPHVLNKSLYKMENRLINEGDKGREWFGEDGILLALPDPLKENPSRPFIPETISEPALQTEFKQAYLNEFDSRFIDGSNEAKGQYMLAVDVNALLFHHHHLFSREHVLAARLTRAYEEFILRAKKNTVTYLAEKLKALKSAAAHVQENINKMESVRGERKNRAGIADQKKRLKEYSVEVRETRKQRDIEMKADRELTKSILQTWREIKSLRTFQRCTNTPVKLVIRKEETNKAADEEEWRRDIEDELSEAREDEQVEFEKMMDKYRQDMEKYKQQRQAKKDAKARQRARRHRHKTGQPLEGTDGNAVDEVEGDADEEEQINKDQEILDEDDIEKPEKPESTFGPEARERIEAKYEEIRRKPGEPIIIPELTNGATVTANNQCPRGEQNRRNDVNRYSIFVKVLFNNKEVSKTTPKPLGQEFLVRFTQILNIEIVQWPESIKIEIYETAGFSTRKLDTVHCAIPEPNVSTENVGLEDMPILNHTKQPHNHEGVGSGVMFSFEKDNTNKISLSTSGMFTCSVAWALDAEGQALVPPSSQAPSLQQHSALKGLDAIQGIGMSSAADLDKLSKWIEESRLDPNDPKNADLMYLMRPAGGGDAMLTMLRLPEHFRLEHLQEEFDIATDDEIANSKRFKFLQLRSEEEADFRHKICPILEKEIPEDIFIEWDKKKSEREKVKAIVGDSHAVAVAKFMNTVREQVMRRMRMLMHTLTFEEVIFEDAVPNIGTILPSLSKLLEPKRPLKPVRRERKKVTAHNLQAMDVKLLVNIVRAFDIPVRAEALEPAKTGSKKGKVKNIAGNVLVRPFVEVLFQRNSVATSVADGPNPSWNEELSIPFKAPGGDYSSPSLQTITDVLYLNLFDEYVIDTQQADADRGASVHRRIEKRWLGSLKIPFSTIYAASRIDGTFRIRQPPVLLGYTQDTRSNNEDIGQIGGENTCITLFITVEPGLTAAEPNKEKFDSNEDESLLTASEKWLQPLEKKFPKREIKCTVVDINGKLVFITRYFRELKPPPELLEGGDDEAKAERVARYVSLIPFVSDAVIFPGIVDIWSTCDQFLQMMQGDEEEHAVLLTNYFLGMGKRAWLLLGSAIPEGPTAYVVTDEGNDFWVWNASTGEHFSYRDNYCPVQSVGCLVNGENIYANVQPNDQPSRISFDLKNTSHWKAFFNKSYPFPGLSSVQPKSLLYHDTPKELIMEITEKIERILKDKIMSWRPKFITRWNRYCVHTFRKLLLKLEETRGVGQQEEHSRELDQILGSYKLCGFPINLPYTGTIDPIVEAVFATGVHRLESSNVEFALAVHIHPYPNRVLSVWVYVASLVRKR